MTLYLKNMHFYDVPYGVYEVLNSRKLT